MEGKYSKLKETTGWILDVLKTYLKDDSILKNMQAVIVEKYTLYKYFPPGFFYWGRYRLRCVNMTPRIWSQFENMLQITWARCLKKLMHTLLKVYWQKSEWNILQLCYNKKNFWIFFTVPNRILFRKVLGHIWLLRKSIKCLYNCVLEHYFALVSGPVFSISCKG